MHIDIADCRDVRAGRLRDLLATLDAGTAITLVIVDDSTPSANASTAAIVASRARLSAAPSFELSREEAEEVARGAMHLDLAYRTPRVSAAAASEIAGTFMLLFEGSGARFFTNGDIGLAHARNTGIATWGSLTKATFDTGVMALGETRIGIFWFEDED